MLFPSPLPSPEGEGELLAVFLQTPLHCNKYVLRLGCATLPSLRSYGGQAAAFRFLGTRQCSSIGLIPCDRIFRFEESEVAVATRLRRSGRSAEIVSWPARPATRSAVESASVSVAEGRMTAASDAPSVGIPVRGSMTWP